VALGVLACELTGRLARFFSHFWQAGRLRHTLSLALQGRPGRIQASQSSMTTEEEKDPVLKRLKQGCLH